jgi:hypothetical protein
MPSQTDIINLALFKLGSDQTVASLSEQSKAARVFNRLWEPTRDIVLADGVWPWAMKAEQLAQSTDDNLQGWGYRYARPNDCITAWAITDVGGLRAARGFGGISCFCWDMAESPLRGFVGDFDQVYGDVETEILTDMQDAWLVYTVRVEDTGRYPPHFVDALASRLAADAAGAMIGEVGLNAKPRLMQEYQLSRSIAAAHDYNEGQNSAQYTTPSMAARL